MNTIIALRGIGNSGKSETLRILHEILLENGFIVIESNYRPNRKDFYSILNKNEILIGITSLGDTYEILKNKLDLFIGRNCKVCVCACRSRGGTNYVLLEYPGYISEFVEKTIKSNLDNRNEINRDDADTLFSTINNLVTNMNGR